MSDPHDDPIEELLAAYALDSVDDDERRRVDQALVDRGDLRDQLRSYEDALAGWVEADASAGSSVEPPGSAWAAVQAHVHGERASNVVAVRPRRRWQGPMLMVAAAVVLLVGAGLAINANGRSSTVSDRLAEALSDPRTSTTAVGDAVVVLTHSNRLIVDARRLRALADSNTYQLWSLDGSSPISLGLVPPGSVVELEIGTRPTKVAISQEPAGGSRTPTGPIIGSGETL